MKPAVRILCYYTDAFFQGVCLIFIPAAGFILRSPEANGISQSQYGLLFLPMISVTIIVTLNFTALLGRFGRRGIYQAAQASDLLYLLFLFLTRWTEGNPAASFGLLLVSNLFLGGGFGLLVSVLNILTVEALPRHRDSVLVGLHAFLGVGAAAAPLIVQFFYDRGDWTKGVLLTGALGIAMLTYSLLSFRGRSSSPPHTLKLSTHGAQGEIFSMRAKLFLLAIFLYGIIESIVGNWSTAYLIEEKKFPPAATSSALATFWFFIMAGRLLSALLSLKLRPEGIYRVLPLVILSGLMTLKANTEETAVPFIYMVTGLGCSAFFPMSLSLPSGYFHSLRERLASLGITSLMMGVGFGTSLLGFFFERHWLFLRDSITIALAAAFGLLVLSQLIIKPPTHDFSDAGR